MDGVDMDSYQDMVDDLNEVYSEAQGADRVREAAFADIEALQQRVAELEAALHWLLLLFHMRHDDAGWRVVMREYPPSPEDCERSGELAARYGVAVSVAPDAAPEPVPDAPAGDDVEPMARFDTLANGRRHDAVD